LAGALLAALSPSLSAYGGSAFSGLERFGPAAEIAVPLPAAKELKPLAKPIKAPDFAFSDEGYISGFILKCVANSKTSIDLALYGITLADVAEALLKAKSRGVRVRVIMNQSHVFTKPSAELQSLIDGGVELRTLRGQGQWGIMHNKIAIYDGILLQTGSFNWTQAADRDNFENVVFRKDARTISLYQTYFDWMWSKTRAVADGPVTEILPPDYFGAPPADAAPSVAFNGGTYPLASFSPKAGTAALVIDAANRSQKSISVAMYSFYHTDLANALLAAKNRGVKVTVVTDRLQASNSPLTKFFTDNGFDFRLARGYGGRGIMHNKFAVFDGTLLVTGSFNWTGSGDKNNFENLLFSAAASDISGFEKEFAKIYAKSSAPDKNFLQSLPSDIPEARMALIEQE